MGNIPQRRLSTLIPFPQFSIAQQQQQGQRGNTVKANTRGKEKKFNSIETNKKGGYPGYRITQPPFFSLTGFGAMLLISRTMVSYAIGGKGWGWGYDGVGLSAKSVSTTSTGVGKAHQSAPLPVPTSPSIHSPTPQQLLLHYYTAALLHCYTRTRTRTTA